MHQLRGRRSALKGAPALSTGGLFIHLRADERRRTLEGQLERLSATAVNLWILRGFIEEQCSVTDTMLTVRVRAPGLHITCLSSRQSASAICGRCTVEERQSHATFCVV